MTSKVKALKNPMKSHVLTSGGRGKLHHSKKPFVSKSDKSGLKFPVGRIGRFLKNGKYSERVSSAAPIFLAAVMEYLTAEIMELSGNAAKDNKKQRIIPRHIQLAVKNDVELSKLLSDVVISNGGVVPNIHPNLLPMEKKMKSNIKEMEG